MDKKTFGFILGPIHLEVFYLLFSAYLLYEFAKTGC